jgi:hypothetical protein
VKFKLAVCVDNTLVLSNNSKDNFEDLTPFRLEEILFGRGRDWMNENNPRRIYSEFINSRRNIL